MQKLIIIKVIVLLVTGMCLPHKADASYPDVAKGVVSRLLPSVSDKFQFEEIPDANGLDVFEVQASGDIVSIKGNTAVAMCRGVYDYLKKDCNAIVNCDGDQLELPDPLPNTANRRVISKVEHREFMQTCTFGYSAPYWDWDRWERELDWMALHGINMPLSEVGQEKALQNVLLTYGFTNQEILNEFFSGPAQLPWFRMGNIYKTGGPMPQSFVDFQSTLQKKIIERQLEMGMKTIVPGFSAFVPPSFKTKFPSAQTLEVDGFGGQKTLQIDPRDPMFAEITRKFMDEYKTLYGAHAGLYSVDLYNEMLPPVTNATVELAEIGGKVHSAIKAADPNAIWVMMGWTFTFHPSFWTNANIQAFFQNIPVEDHITLDLGAGNDSYVAWSKFPALQNRKLIWCHISSFGGRNFFQGNMKLIAPKPYEAFNALDASHMVGMGITAEATDNNMAMIEILTDEMWLQSAPNVETWVREYGGQRYGTKSQASGDIWNGILQNLYNWQGSSYDTYKMFYEEVPRSDNLPQKWTNSNMRDLLVMMLSHGNDLYKSELYRHDLVEVARRYFGEWAGNYLIDAIRSSGSTQAKHIETFNTLMLGIDSLLANIPIYRLDRWINNARSIVPDGDKDFMERNAREILSYWWFVDYAYKGWAGMVASYYRVRWNKFFDGGNSAVSAFHNNWLTDHNLPEIKETDVYTKIAELLKITDSINVDPVPIAVDKKSAINNASFAIRFGSGYFNIITGPDCRYEITLYSLKGARHKKIRGKGNQIYRTDKLGIAPGLFIVQVQSINMSRTYKVYIQ